MTPNLLWCFLAGGIGMVWGLNELVSAFENETGRALRTGGAWLLIGLNFVAAALIFLLLAALFPETNTWLTAILVGLAWPTVIRNLTFRLSQPLDGSQTSENAVLRFEEAYSAVQNLAQKLINTALTRQRMHLVTEVIRYEIKDLERFARTAAITSITSRSSVDEVEAYLDLVLQRPIDEDRKKVYLATFIFTRFNHEMLRDFVNEQRKAPANRDAPAPPATSSSAIAPVEAAGAERPPTS